MRKLSIAFVLAIMALLFVGCSDSGTGSGGKSGGDGRYDDEENPQEQEKDYTAYVSKDSEDNIYSLSVFKNNTFRFCGKNNDEYAPFLDETGDILSKTKDENGIENIDIKVNGSILNIKINYGIMTEISGNIISDNDEIITTQNLIEVSLPVIDNIAISTKDTIRYGEEYTQITLIVDVTSNVKLVVFGGSFYGPNGNIWGGSVAVGGFEEISNGHWRYIQKDYITQYAPTGEYYYENLHVGDYDIELGKYDYLQSETYKGELKTTITNSIVAQKPIINNITLSKEVYSDYTDIVMTVYAKSNVPMHFFSGSFYAPNGENIWGGGVGVSFDEISTGNWQYVRKDRIYNDKPRGEYYYQNIRIENAGYLESDVWKGELKINID